jgi:hypothetical protein
VNFAVLILDLPVGQLKVLRLGSERNAFNNAIVPRSKINIHVLKLYVLNYTGKTK